jgi:hypothetical protein
MPVNIQLSKIKTDSTQLSALGFQHIPAENRLLMAGGILWWAWVESNYRPHPYQGCALAD